jgi:pyruvate formate lyase activating enzyme
METAQGVVFNIQSYSIHDGPGIRTVVFFKGCPLSCHWCSNPESQDARPELGVFKSLCKKCGRCVETCPNGAISLAPGGDPVTDRTRCVLCGACERACPHRVRKIYGRAVSATDLMQEIQKDAPFYVRSGGGVTFSGGEPTLQFDLLVDLLRECRARYIHTAVETCGFLKDDGKLDTLLSLVDLLLYDIKCIDDDKHRKLTGVSNETILRNARRIASSGGKMIVRVPLIPGFNANREDVEAIGDFVLSLITVKEVNLLPYHELGSSKYGMLDREYGFGGAPPLTDGKVEEFRAYFESCGLVCTVD